MHNISDFGLGQTVHMPQLFTVGEQGAIVRFPLATHPLTYLAGLTTPHTPGNLAARESLMDKTLVVAERIDGDPQDRCLYDHRNEAGINVYDLLDKFRSLTYVWLNQTHETSDDLYPITALNTLTFWNGLASNAGRVQMMRLVYDPLMREVFQVFVPFVMINGKHARAEIRYTKSLEADILGQTYDWEELAMRQSVLCSLLRNPMIISKYRVQIRRHVLAGGLELQGQPGTFPALPADPSQWEILKDTDALYETAVERMFMTNPGVLVANTKGNAGETDNAAKIRFNPAVGFCSRELIREAIKANKKVLEFFPLPFNCIDRITKDHAIFSTARRVRAVNAAVRR